MTDAESWSAKEAAKLVNMLSKVDTYILSMNVEEHEMDDIIKIAKNIADCYFMARKMTIIRAGYEVDEPEKTE